MGVSKFLEAQPQISAVNQMTMEQGKILYSVFRAVAGRKFFTLCKK